MSWKGKRRGSYTLPYGTMVPRTTGYGFLAFLRGLGKITLDPGNMGNPPGDPPVETGTLGFIQQFAFQGNGHIASDLSVIPPAFRDWGQIGLNVADPSGQTGGGVSTGLPTDLPDEANLYFDPQTGIYYDLG